MSRPIRHRALALASGGLVAAGVWWFVRDPALAGAVGVSALVGALLWFRVERNYGDRFEDETWRDRKWIALGTLVVYLVAYNGTLLLPLPLADRVGLQALVLGAALVGYAVGTLTEIERGTHDDGEASDAVAPADD
ncbi:MAG: hypothetical protein ABEJ40_07945 [Haloarculaceae archaeon]